VGYPSTDGGIRIYVGRGHKFTVQYNGFDQSDHLVITNATANGLFLWQGISGGKWLRGGWVTSMPLWHMRCRMLHRVCPTACMPSEWVRCAQSACARSASDQCGDHCWVLLCCRCVHAGTNRSCWANYDGDRTYGEQTITVRKACTCFEYQMLL
jgi:hypothetical protein